MLTFWKTFNLSHSFPVQLAENCVAVVSALESRYPGGWSNLRSLHLQAGSCSLPLYVSLRSPAQV